MSGGITVSMQDVLNRLLKVVFSLVSLSPARGNGEGQHVLGFKGNLGPAASGSLIPGEYANMVNGMQVLWVIWAPTRILFQKLRRSDWGFFWTGKKANKHTIILMQASHNRASRTFMDYDSISQAMDGICGLYERKLKELNPAIRNMTYDIEDHYNFIDGLADLSALVYEHSKQAYLPYDRQWIKQKTFQHLKKLAS